MKPRTLLPLILIALLILPVLLFAQAKPERTQVPIALTHVTVIDVAGGPARRDATVVIAGDRIAAHAHRHRGRGGGAIPRDFPGAPSCRNLTP